MNLWKTLNIADHERALLYRRGRLVDVLGPGHYRLHPWRGELTTEIFDITAGPFVHERKTFLLNNFRYLLSEHLQTFQTTGHQVGLLYRDDVLSEILLPSSALTLWRGVEKLRIAYVDIGENYRLDAVLLDSVAPCSKLTQELNSAFDEALIHATVAENEVGIVSLNGSMVEVLPPGVYGFWRCNRALAFRTLALGPREHAVEVACVTRDRFSLSVDLVAQSEVACVETHLAKKVEAEALIPLGLKRILVDRLRKSSVDQVFAEDEILLKDIQKIAEECFQTFGMGVKILGFAGMRLVSSDSTQAAIGSSKTDKVSKQSA